MSVTLAIGTQIQIASGYGSSKAMSAISNASAAVATLAASHGVAGADYIEMTSGWGRLDGRVLRALSVSTNDVTIEGLDTSDTSRYPAGTGTGSVREISGWTTISQLTRQLQVSGGGQNYADISTLDDVLDKRIPTTRQPIDVGLPLFFDPSLSWWATVLAAAEASTPTAVRFVFPNGSKLVANARWSLLEVPTIEDSTLRTRIDLAFSAAPKTYTT